MTKIGVTKPNGIYAELIAVPDLEAPAEKVEAVAMAVIKLAKVWGDIYPTEVRELLGESETSMTPSEINSLTYRAMRTALVRADGLLRLDWCMDEDMHILRVAS